MAVLNNQKMVKYEIVFSKDTELIISEILQKNGLEETDEDIFKKLEKEEPLIGELILGIVEKITLGEIQEKDVSSFFQKQLNLSEEKAEQIAKDIKENIIPFAEKIVTEEEIERETDVSDVFTEIKPPIGIPPIGSTIDAQITTPIKAPIKTEEDDFNIKKPVIEKTEESFKKRENPVPSKPDIYREPIE